MFGEHRRDIDTKSRDVESGWEDEIRVIVQFIFEHVRRDA